MIIVIFIFAKLWGLNRAGQCHILMYCIIILDFAFFIRNLYIHSIYACYQFVYISPKSLVCSFFPFCFSCTAPPPLLVVHIKDIYTCKTHVNNFQTTCWLQQHVLLIQLHTIAWLSVNMKEYDTVVMFTHISVFVYMV